MGRLFDCHFRDVNTETKTATEPRLFLDASLYLKCLILDTWFMAYTQNHGFILLWHIPLTQVFTYLKFDIGMVNILPAPIFFISKHFTNIKTCVPAYSVLVCCLSAISMNVYICMKISRYISGANWFNLGSP